MRRGWIVVGAVVGAWLLLLGAIALAAVAVVARGGGEWEEFDIQGDGDAKVAMIRVEGEIHGGRGGSGFSVSTGADDVLSQLRQAEADPDVAALILRIDSPGGAVVASDEIYSGILRAAEQIPVVASMGEMAASGGYYLASAAERIVANRGTLTGSIGVLMMLPNLEGTASKLGIQPRVLTAGDLKDAGSPFKELTEQERALFQRLLDEAHDRFVEAVASGRGMDPADVRKLADGRVYSGLQASENGLVDELGDLEEAYDAALDLAALSRDEARLIEYGSSPGFGGLFPFLLRSPVEEVERELGIGFGLKYLYLS